MIRAAENLGANIEAAGTPASVDFDALPGRSPEARAEALYVGRRIRDGLFPRNVFSEPAWDILLALFLAKRSGKSLEIDAVFYECAIPVATGRRFVNYLAESDLVEIDDDRGAPHCVLSATGSRLLRRFFELTEGVVPAGRRPVTPLLRLIAGID